MSRVGGKAPPPGASEIARCMQLMAAMLCPLGWGYLPAGTYRTDGGQITNDSPAIFHPMGAHPAFLHTQHANPPAV